LAEGFWISVFKLSPVPYDLSRTGTPENCPSRTTPNAGGCVKTLTKIFGQKIDRLEPTSDDRHLGNGFGTPNFSASLDNF
jgi:hypothetical protein